MSERSSSLNRRDNRRLSVSFVTPEQPSRILPPSSSPSQRPLDFEMSSILWVRACWVDYAGLLRFRVVPKSRYDRMVANPPSHLISITAAIMALGPHDELAPGFGPVGELYLQPDKNSFRPLPYEPGHAMVMCNVLRKRELQEFASPRSESTTGEAVLSAYPLCPRLILSSTLHSSVSECGVAYLVGFEIELVLLSSTEPELVPVDGPRREHAWSRSSAARSGSKGLHVIQKVVEALDEAGISVEQWHPESAPGSFEIVLSPHAPFQACDELIYAREAASNISNQMGVRCTFAPKPYVSQAGTGAHVHISLHRRKTSKQERPGSSPIPAPFPSPSSRPLSMSPNISVLESHWLAGVLHHLPAICAFTLPSAFSYDRVTEGTWAGGVWVTWGTANREAPVRLCVSGPAEHNFEVKCQDATSNVYLALSAILTAGLLGVQTPLELMQNDCRVDAAKMTPAERIMSRITTSLPRSIDESLAALEKDPVLMKSLGAVFCRAYMTIKRGEAERYRTLPGPARRLFAVENY